MGTRRAAAAGGGRDGDGEGGEEAAEKNGSAAAAVSHYEQIRAQRIKENMARLQGMGIFDLTRQLNSFKPKPPKRPRRSDDLSVQAKTHPSRRSSRLQNVEPVSYAETVKKASVEPKKIRRVRNPSQNVSNPQKKRRSFHSDSETETDSEPGSELDLESNSDSDLEVKVKIPIRISGSPPRRSTRLRDVAPVRYVEPTSPKVEREPLESVEIETSEGVDGEDVKQIHDKFKDETCHQCSQRTLGALTHCSKCDLVQGQFCGDCLAMGYGENVIEANQNPDWFCPVCRGICNCSLCLHGKELMDDFNKTKNKQELMQNNIKQELDGHLVGKEEMIKANFLDSEHVPAEDVGKQDAATIFVAVDSDSETKIQPRRSTRTSNVHVAAEDICKQDPTADEAVDCQTKKGNVRVALADLGILDAAGDNVNGESKIQRRSTRTRRK